MTVRENGRGDVDIYWNGQVWVDGTTGSSFGSPSGSTPTPWDIASGNVGSSYIIPPVTSSPTNSNVGSSSNASRVSASQPRVWQWATIAAIGAPIAIVYGRDRVSAKLLYKYDHNNNAVLVVLWCAGPVDAIERIEQSDGSDIPAGVTITTYDGNQTTVDPTIKAIKLAAGVSDFNYPMTGVAYSVIQIPTSLTSFAPSGLNAIVRGFRVYDPRDLTQNLDDSSTWKWSENAALCLADFASSTKYGYSKKMLWDTVSECADFNDDENRKRSINWHISERIDTTTVIETLCMYAGCYLRPEGEYYELYPDRDSVPVGDVLPRNYDTNYPKISWNDRLGLPNSVEVSYTDRDVSPWSSNIEVSTADGAIIGSEPFVSSTFSLPGIAYDDQAAGEALERRLKFKLGRMTINARVLKVGAAYKQGDILNFFHPLHPEGKPYRLTAPPKMVAFGVHDLTATEHQPGMYSQNPNAEATYPATTLPDPSAPPNISGLVIIERLYQNSSGQWASRFVAAWDRPTAEEWPYDLEYFVEMTQAGAHFDPLHVAYAEAYLSPTVVEGQEYQFRVAVKTKGFVGEFTSVSITAIGQRLPPTNVEAFTEIMNSNGTVHLAWMAAGDIDTITYEVRRAPGAGVDLSALSDDALDALWNSAAVVASTDALRVALSDQPEGKQIYLVKAKDTFNNYSSMPCAELLNVVIDEQYRFVDIWPLIIVATENATKWWALADPKIKYTSDRGEMMNYGHQDQDDVTGSFEDLASVPFCLPHDGAESYVLSETKDLGIVVTGTWYLTADIDDHNETSDRVIELSNDGQSWRQYTASGIAANARYARVRIKTDGAFTLNDAPVLSLDAVPRTEEGELLVGRNGTYTAITREKYSGFIGHGVDLQYLGTENYSPARGQITIMPDGTARFDIYLRNENGERVSGRVSWQFYGV